MAIDNKMDVYSVSMMGGINSTKHLFVANLLRILLTGLKPTACAARTSISYVMYDMCCSIASGPVVHARGRAMA